MSDLTTALPIDTATVRAEYSDPTVVESAAGRHSALVLRLCSELDQARTARDDREAERVALREVVALVWDVYRILDDDNERDVSQELGEALEGTTDPGPWCCYAQDVGHPTTYCSSDNPIHAPSHCGRRGGWQPEKGVRLHEDLVPRLVRLLDEQLAPRAGEDQAMRVARLDLTAGRLLMPSMSLLRAHYGFPGEYSVMIGMVEGWVHHGQ